MWMLFFISSIFYYFSPSTGTGHLASSTYDASAFFRTGMNPDLPYPDAQISVFCALGDYSLWKDNLGMDPDEYGMPRRLLEDDGEGGHTTLYDYNMIVNQSCQ